MLTKDINIQMEVENYFKRLDFFVKKKKISLFRMYAMLIQYCGQYIHM